MMKRTVIIFFCIFFSLSVYATEVQITNTYLLSSDSSTFHIRFIDRLSSFIFARGCSGNDRGDTTYLLNGYPLTTEYTGYLKGDTGCIPIHYGSTYTYDQGKLTNILASENSALKVLSYDAQGLPNKLRFSLRLLEHCDIEPCQPFDVFFDEKIQRLFIDMPDGPDLFSAKTSWTLEALRTQQTQWPSPVITTFVEGIYHTIPPNIQAGITQIYSVDDTYARPPLLIEEIFDMPTLLTTLWTDYNPDLTVRRYSMIIDYKVNGKADGVPDEVYSISYSYYNLEVIEGRDVYGNVFTYKRDRPIGDPLSMVYNIVNQNGYSYFSYDYYRTF